MNRSGIRVAITALVVTAGVGLTACSHSAPAPSPGPSADPARSRIQDASTAAAPVAAAPAAAAARPNAATTPDSSLANGRHPARITAVDAEGEQVTIDVVQFFFGDAATEAARADGSTDLPPPNDHWIRNANPELRTLPVAAHAAVTVNGLSWAETGSATSNSTISLSKLASYGDVRGSLFWVTTRDGAVTGIGEQFLP
jgi:hypothetical protein